MAKAKTQAFDFTGVEDRAAGARPRRKPEGDYYAHIKSVEDFESKEGNAGWLFLITTDGDSRASYPYYVMFDPKQAWKPRGLCVAAGMKVPQSKVKLDPNKLVGKAIGIALVDDEYEGRPKSTIDAILPLDDLEDARNQPGKSSSAKAKSRQAEDDDDEDDEDEDEEPAPRKGKGKRAPEPEPDDDDEDDDDEDDEPPAKSKKGKAAQAKSKKKAPVEDDDDEDEEDDDEEPPAKKSKGKTPAKKSKKKSKSDDDDDDELDLDDL